MIATFKYNVPYNQKISFAFSVPWTVKKNKKFLEHYEQKCPNYIVFRKEWLCNSLDGRKIELLTITGKNKML